MVKNYEVTKEIPGI